MTNTNYVVLLGYQHLVFLLTSCTELQLRGAILLVKVVVFAGCLSALVYNCVVVRNTCNENDEL